MSGLGAVEAMWLAAASILAYYGTNVQAEHARRRLLTDDDPRVVAAGQTWTPVWWLSLPAKRRRRARVEGALRDDPELWARYRILRRELSAWNALESSVVLVAAASVIALARAVVTQSAVRVRYPARPRSVVNST
jgi:hypothetical protein